MSNMKLKLEKEKIELEKLSRRVEKLHIKFETNLTWLPKHYRDVVVVGNVSKLGSWNVKFLSQFISQKKELD